MANESTSYCMSCKVLPNCSTVHHCDSCAAKITAGERLAEVVERLVTAVEAATRLCPPSEYAGIMEANDVDNAMTEIRTTLAAVKETK